MIRIVTARNEAGFPTDWEEFEEVQADTVPMILTLRFDRELAAMVKEGLFIGVNRWSEAAWKVQKFQVDSVNKLADMGREAAESDSGPSADELAEVEDPQESEDFVEWVVSHPYYTLTKQVGIWAAVNMSGKRQMTLREVYELAERDVDSTGFDEPFIDEDEIDDGEDEAGKA